ncbi:saccharopine dehydrogenase family protein [Leptolyngbya iicbica]|uniref:SDR family NAD(P)-dependent oxidoreductase n=2 Tax=Cyanophyceae TaxID=3028117 RepID=A0A4Q7E9Z4_9CYAN|nr:SDR family NAD(P)-dependent oxidoreductase [Leptolyngbya sp. LK]RZM79707.1 SDR family NAD(P)-dependent oxidoreductase [Leptolyngbya sp. LK]
MTKVLIVGGTGRIGSSIAQDLLAHTDAEVVLTGRHPQRGQQAAQALGPRSQFLPLDLTEKDKLRAAIATADLVVHAAGPFHQRDTQVLQTCIEQGGNYLDVSDYRGFTRQALALTAAAQTAGVTAIVNTGVFPGISNSLVRQGVEALDQADAVQLSYIVAGSGGAGVTVMRTTFLGLQHPFDAWLDGQWQTVKPYTAREKLTFPSPYGDAYVYWYDMPEAMTLANSFPLQTVITKFGVVPDFYNRATWLTAHGLPKSVLQHPNTVEFLARISYWMTEVSDRFTGTGVAIRCDIQGTQAGETVHHHSAFVHDSAAIAAGIGAGYIAELLLSGELAQPGVYPVEQAVTTSQLLDALTRRQLSLQTPPLEARR